MWLQAQRTVGHLRPSFHPLATPPTLCRNDGFRGTATSGTVGVPAGTLTVKASQAAVPSQPTVAGMPAPMTIGARALTGKALIGGVALTGHCPVMMRQ